MKRIRIIAAFTVAAVTAGFFGTASAVSWKDFKEAAKKDFNEKVNQASGKGSSEDAEESTSASSSSKSSKSGGKSSGSVKAAAANRGPNSEDDFEWEVNDELTEITIKKYKGQREDVEIPAAIQDVPVTSIGGFRGKSITSVIIPDSVKVIGYAAFQYCKKLQSVVIPASGTIIGDEAFSGCEALQSVVIPKGCKLGHVVFASCTSLSSVTLPDDMQVIPAGFFSGCKSLSQIKWPASLKRIDGSAFAGCPFTSVDLPEGLEYLGALAFTGDTITSVSLPKTLKWVEIDGPDFSTNYAILGDNIETITIASGCAPKNYGRGGEVDGRDMIKGAKIDKSKKLKKQLRDLKIGKMSEADKKEYEVALKSWGVE